MVVVPIVVVVVVVVFMFSFCERRGYLFGSGLRLGGFCCVLVGWYARHVSLF